ncbi:MAG: MlaD family protein [Syntrophorhabdales bacterium]
MSKAANKTMIGAFVLGAVALAVIAVVIFGSGKFFTTKQHYELYFQGSVQGLDVGSPVMFRGVKVGSVSDISLTFIPKELTFYIPVTIDIEPDRAKWLGPPHKREGQLLKPLIDRGLRGQLQTLSLVTGQLAVALDFFPGQPARFVGQDTKYPEIPTVPSTFAQLTKTFQELPIQSLFAKLDSAVTAINTLVGSDAAQTSMKTLDQSLRQATALMKTIDARIGPLAASLQDTSNGIHSVATKLGDSLSGDRGVPVQLQQTLETARKTLAQVEQTLASVQAMAQENSTMGYEIGTAVSEMSRSMRSLRNLSDYLERHPEALLRGKRP